MNSKWIPADPQSSDEAAQKLLDEIKAFRTKAARVQQNRDGLSVDGVCGVWKLGLLH